MTNVEILDALEKIENLKEEIKRLERKIEKCREKCKHHFEHSNGDKCKKCGLHVDDAY